jgi:hypothetical protein
LVSGKVACVVSVDGSAVVVGAVVVIGAVVVGVVVVCGAFSDPSEINVKPIITPVTTRTEITPPNRSHFLGI